MKMSVEQAEQTIPDDFGMERALDQVQKAGANFRSLADAWCDTSPRMASCWLLFWAVWLSLRGP